MTTVTSSSHTVYRLMQAERRDFLRSKERDDDDAKAAEEEEKDGFVRRIVKGG